MPINLEKTILEKEIRDKSAKKKIEGEGAVINEGKRFLVEMREDDCHIIFALLIYLRNIFIIVLCLELIEARLKQMRKVLNLERVLSLEANLRLKIEVNMPILN